MFGWSSEALCVSTASVVFDFAPLTRCVGKRMEAISVSPTHCCLFFSPVLRHTCILYLCGPVSVIHHFDKQFVVILLRWSWKSKLRSKLWLAWMRSASLGKSSLLGTKKSLPSLCNQGSLSETNLCSLPYPDSCHDSKKQTSCTKPWRSQWPAWLGSHGAVRPGLWLWILSQMLRRKIRTEMEWRWNDDAKIREHNGTMDLQRPAWQQANCLGLVTDSATDILRRVRGSAISTSRKFADTLHSFIDIHRYSWTFKHEITRVGQKASTLQ